MKVICKSLKIDLENENNNLMLISYLKDIKYS